MLNLLERALLIRKLSQNLDRVKRLESLLQGKHLSTVKIADAFFTNAKIGSLNVNKLTTGRLAVGTLFDIGDVAGGNYIRKSGEDVRILMYESSVPQLIIGMQSGTPVIKVGKDGTNALTDDNPDNFVLYVDQTTDYILIKEKARVSRSVSSYSSENVAHGLGYVPFCLVFYEVSTDVFRKVQGSPAPGWSLPYFLVNSTNLILYNPTGNTVIFKCYIFYEVAEWVKK